MHAILIDNLQGTKFSISVLVLVLISVSGIYPPCIINLLNIAALVIFHFLEKLAILNKNAFLLTYCILTSTKAATYLALPMGRLLGSNDLLEQSLWLCDNVT